MTQNNPKYPAQRPTSTPSQQSTSTMPSSPPLSPSSSLPPPSDDDFPSDLSDSWLEVEESSVGPSILGDMVFSDTSSDSHHDHEHDHEARSQWSASSDGGRDADVEDADAGAVILEPSHEDDSLVNSPSLNDYTDAEASTHKLGSSIDTLHTSSDRIQLIFPAGESFTTSSSGTLSGGFTPSASLSALKPMAHPDQPSRSRAGTTVGPALSPITALGKMSPRRSSSPVTRGVEDSWLKSSKLWRPPKNEEGDRHREDDREYQLLQSDDNITAAEPEQGDGLTFRSTHVPNPSGGIDVHQDSRTKKDRIQTFLEDAAVSQGWLAAEDPGESEGEKDVIEEMQRKQISASDNVEAIKSIAKKWSTRVSYFALASFLSITLLRSFGSSFFVPFVPEPKEYSSATTSTVSPTQVKSTSFWDHLPFASPASTSSESSVSTTPITAVQPDPRLIQQALATLSSLVLPETMPLSTASTKKDADEQQETTQRGFIKPCCALSIRNNVVALSIPSTSQASRSSITKKLTQKLLRTNKTDNITSLDATSAQVAAQNCTCSLSTLAHSSIHDIIDKAFGSVSAYTIYLASVFGPIIATLEKELGSTYSFVARTVRIGVNTTRTSINTAARGAHVLKNSLSDFFASHAPSASEELSKASAMFDSLSEYVEERFEALEEQAEVMQEKSIESLYQAKRGLDRLISDLKKFRGIEDKTSTDVEKDGPLPFAHMKHSPTSHRRRHTREGKLKSRVRREGRRDKKMQGNWIKDKKDEVLHPMPPMEKPSRKRKILDQIHHVSVFAVLRRSEMIL
ncbi:uncharacterized protein I303_100953 [Kwoniella dejecticola CBS 10117]|uniref:Uncharacterized protein n=1 Tax=Kwoniella dejecticola CBS 10117 TaxID=1296121 RepID=A0A1A6AGD1_9TREE|nr:uncharacterized protein I303_00957 [Kwoniella dejecticola CBS 10117]OBR89135.1 hypothetical protein I303_00957 [Kwoniella dejecticola CBS 10117]